MKVRENECYDQTLLVREVRDTLDKEVRRQFTVIGVPRNHCTVRDESDLGESVGGSIKC